LAELGLLVERTQQVELARAALLGVITGHIKAEVGGPLWERCVEIITTTSRE
jgi:hypothetical protein